MSRTRPADEVPDLQELRDQLHDVLSTEAAIAPKAHARRLTVISTILCEALRRHGLSAMLVGGSALEFHAPGAYVTGDIDMPVAKDGLAPPRGAVDAVFGALGFRKGSARHWERSHVLVEVPNHDLDAPSEEYQVGPYRLRVVAKEAVLVGRLVEYDQTGHTGYAAQAILMLRVFAGTLDEALLSRLVRQERVAGAHAILLRFAQRAPEWVITDEELRMARDRLRGYNGSDDRGDLRDPNLPDGEGREAGDDDPDRGPV